MHVTRWGTIVVALTAGTPAAVAQDGAVLLDEVIVTPGRAARPVSDVPQSVTIIERGDIERALRLSSDAADAISRLVPGFSVDNQTVTGASETFRGRGLLVLVDGVSRNTPLRDASRILSLIDLNTVERIEVVAGSSSIYGSGATGGTINFITKKAADGAPQISVNTNLRTFTADVGESLAPNGSVTISGRHESGFDYVFTATGRHAGKTFDGAGNQLPSDPMLGQGGGDRFDALNGFMKLGYDFDETRRLEFSGEWTWFDQEPDWLTTFVPYTTTTTVVPGLGPTTVYTFDFTKPAQPDFSNPYPGDSTLEDSKYVTARYTDQSFALGELDVKLFHNDIRKRYAYSEAGFANPYVYTPGAAGLAGVDPADPSSLFSAFTSPFNQTTQDSRVTGLNATVDSSLDHLLPGMRLVWGGDYSFEETEQQFGDGADAIAPMDQHSFGAFGQLEVPLGERVTMRGGLRYDRFDLTVDSFTRPAYNLVAPLTLTGLYPGTVLYVPGLVPATVGPTDFIGGDATYDAVTFNIGAAVKITEEAELFGGFSQGFALPDVGAFTRRAGLVGATTALPAVAFDQVVPEPQLVNNYEIGVRGDWGITRASLSGFISTSDEGVNFNISTNQLTQEPERIWGIEFKGEHDVTDAFTIGAVVSYREGERKADLDNDDIADTWVSLPNNRISSPFRATLFGEYAFDFGLSLRAEVEYWSGRDEWDGSSYHFAYLFPSLTPVGGVQIFELEPAAMVNVSGSLPLGPGELTFGIENLFDEAYENPTASATRNLPVNGWGRTVSLGYRATF